MLFGKPSELTCLVTAPANPIASAGSKGPRQTMRLSLRPPAAVLLDCKALAGPGSS